MNAALLKIFAYVLSLIAKHKEPFVEIWCREKCNENLFFQFSTSSKRPCKNKNKTLGVT